MRSIAAVAGPIALAYARALRWARLAEKFGKRQLATRMWEKVKGIRRILGARYVVHPMEDDRSVVGRRAGKFRRRWAKLPIEARERVLSVHRSGPIWAWQYLTWPIRPGL